MKTRIIKTFGKFYIERKILLFFWESGFNDHDEQGYSYPHPFDSLKDAEDMRDKVYYSDYAKRIVVSE